MLLPNSKDAMMFDRDLQSHVDFVVTRFKKTETIPCLWGKNPFLALENSQLYLGKTVNTVFLYGNSQLHLRILPWVYRSYQKHGFHGDFFSCALQFWIESIQKHYGKAHSTIPYLKHLLSLDNSMKEKAQEIPPSYLGNNPNLQNLLLPLITHDHEKAMNLLTSYYRKNNCDFSSEIILPIMYEVGRYWEMDNISVADEHQISALISNFIASNQKNETKKAKKTILITPAPNEFHEVGALLIAEEFKNQGWRVIYFQAGTSQDIILDEINKNRPQIIAISIALIIHGKVLLSLVSELKQKFQNIPIILGGKFINDNPEILDRLNCPGGIIEPKKIAELADRLLLDKQID